MYQSTSSVASFDLSKLHDPSKESNIFKQSNPSLPPMYRSSADQTKFTFSNSLRYTHPTHKTSKKQLPQVLSVSLKLLEQQAYPTPSSKQQQKDQQDPKYRRDRSLSINIKSTNQELIESKEYENKISNEYEPIFHEFNQEEPVQIDSFAKSKQQMHQKMRMANVKSRETKNFVPISDSTIKRVESKWLDDEAQQRPQSREQEFIDSPELFSSSQDVQKLSQIYNQVLLKNDTSMIKKLNATNQELKTICKQIVSLLRYDTINSKRKISEDLIISKVYKIITNYEQNKNSKNYAKS